MATVERIRAALQRAAAAGDIEAARVIRSDLAGALQAEADRIKAGGNRAAIRDMSATERVMANIGAGTTNLGMGIAQAVLPEAMEQQYGVATADVDRKRARDADLAASVEGGRAWQGVGEAAPFAIVPTGIVSRGLTAIPKAGATLAAAGVGTRILPTLAAEGAALGAAGGSALPVGEGESRLFNAAFGGSAGAAIPAGLGLLGRGYRMLPSWMPGATALHERAVARQLAAELGDAAGAARRVSRGLARPGITETPSTAVLLQDPRLASTELAYRAMPEFAQGWQQFDDAANRARWDALDATLGDAGSVQAAREATDDFIRSALPKFYKSIKPADLNEQSIGFESAVRARLNAAVRDADPNAQAVYGYIMQQREKGARYSPQALWNIRKTLSSWLEGRPPPGFEGTRGAKMDGPIMDVRAAIDNMLNAASGNKWSRLLDDMSEYAQKEAAQKAGQNIRNVFVDEALGISRKPTRSGAPEVTPGAVRQAFSKFGKNKFGQTLDWPQEDAVRQVGESLSAEDILAASKKSATGGGGSQTTPLLAKVIAQRGGDVGGNALQVLREIARMGQGKQRDVINSLLQDPRYARDLLRLAADQSAPLTAHQRNAILASKVLPVAVVAQRDAE